MTTTVAGFPFWQLSFDKHGNLADPAAHVHFRDELKSAGITDLFIFSHGWNNDQQTASILYEGFFGEMQKLVSRFNLSSNKTIGTAGVFWPSIKWPEGQDSDGGGPASFLRQELKKVFTEHSEQKAVDRLLTRLASQQASDEAIKDCIADLKCLLSSDSQTPEFHDLNRSATAANSDEWRNILEQLSDSEQGDAYSFQGGAAGIGDSFSKLWRGAKSALRVLTHWQMKDRAGIVGRTGLGPELNAMASAIPGIRLNLLGHSFGARLVSYSLMGLNIPQGATSPVKSLFLLQAAFSHFAFANALPFDPSRSGDLKRMNERVDGPLLTTHTLYDTAVGLAYPFASVLANQDASAESDLMYRWEGIGYDGAQAVNAAEVTLGSPPCEYKMDTGKWLNLDANAVIKTGSPPAGAHSDIIHPETAWAALKAAGLY